MSHNGNESHINYRIQVADYFFNRKISEGKFCQDISASVDRKPPKIRREENIIVKKNLCSGIESYAHIQLIDNILKLPDFIIPCFNKSVKVADRSNMRSANYMFYSVLLCNATHLHGHIHTVRSVVHSRKNVAMKIYHKIPPFELFTLKNFVCCNRKSLCRRNNAKLF